MGNEQPGQARAQDEPIHGYEFGWTPEQVAALGHPTRLRILVEAVKAPLSATSFASSGGESVTRISNHIRALADVGLLRVVQRVPRRGAVETFYRAATTLDIPDELFFGLPENARDTYAAANVRQAGDDLNSAVAHGRTGDEDFMLARAHFVVNDEGRRRLRDELERFYGRLRTLSEELTAGDADGKPHEMNVVVAYYEGVRKAGRNGPMVLAGQGELPTIPAE